MTSAEYRLEDRYLSEEGGVLLTGVQALARLPIEQVRRDLRAGRRISAFVSGYPGSPLGGYDMELDRARLLVPDLPVVHQPAVNEELAATSIMGTQLVPGRADATVDGVTGYWYGKAPGIDRASDALRHAVFSGTAPTGGAIALAGDDPHSKSSTLPTNAGRTILSLGMPLLSPSSVEECLELGLHAVAMSRATGMWIGMKIVTPVADGSATLDLARLDITTTAPVHLVDGVPWRCRPTGHLLGTAMVDIEREIHEIRTPLVVEYARLNGLNRIAVPSADAWIGIVSSGYTHHQVHHALSRLGLHGDDAIAAAGIRLLHLRMPVPFDAELVRHFADGLEEIVVISDKDDATDTRVRDALYGHSHQPRVIGNAGDPHAGSERAPSWGLLTAQAIEPLLRSRLAPRLGARVTPEPRVRERVLIPLAEARTPFFCSGCPHNWSTLVPDGAEVGAGIGCSTMVLLMDEERVGHSIGDTAMGSEGAQWTGMSHFVSTDHLFQNLGDGTFFHSGQLAIQHAVASGTHMTFKLLHNGTVAMTGGQSAQGERGLADIVRTLLAHGVAKVAITTDDPARVRALQLPYGVDVHDRRDIVDVQERLREEPGVTVLIHDQACAAEARRRRRRGLQSTPSFRVVINHRICEGCGDCGRVSNCLSVQPIDTPFGRKTTIDQASCNLDLSCLGGDCPAFMTVEAVDHESGAFVAPPAPSLPDPTIVPPEIFRIRLSGIGGTGVVTAAQVLATAAMLDGYSCRGLDQTGLSQKAGPVVSDLVLSRGAPIDANTLGPGEADLIIAFDALVGASDGALDVAHPDRTRVVASTHRTPTGSMVAHPDRPYPADDALIARFGAVSRAESNVFLDAFALATAESGSGAHANTVLVGAAVQSGALPITTASIEQGIRLNGVEVERNLHALTVGRQWVAEPEAFIDRQRSRDNGLQVAAPDVRLTSGLSSRIDALNLPSDLHDLVRLLADDLIGFQNRRVAAGFIDDIERVVATDARVHGEAGPFTEAAARGLHRVTAYKDEYEVARLMLLPDARGDIERVGGRRARFRWHLHPPIMRSLGRSQKITVRSQYAPAMRMLAAGKRLRGHAIDPFGHTRHRRRERELARAYRESLADLCDLADASNYDEVVAAAALVDRVRGYGDLKDGRIDDHHAAMAASLERLRAATPVSTTTG